MSAKFTVLSEESGVIRALEPDLNFPQAIGKYHLLGALGSGGMADVYLAVADGPEGFRKLCVLKLLKETMADDEEFRAMFLDEARLAARLNHPNIVQTFEVGETHGRLMMAMEYIEGQPCHRILKRLSRDQFPLVSYVSVLCDVLEALEYAHGLTDFDGTSLGVVHRDVSPHNIIVGYDGRVKLFDFGIAKSASAMQETQAGVLKGKVGYMAPEQASMLEVDRRSDVFSVGVILWEAIAGKRLVEGIPSRDVLIRRIEGTDPKIADVVPTVDPELAQICDRAMALRPADRFSSAVELQGALEQWLSKRDVPKDRKDLAKAIREAFHEQREQLRTLVEQRIVDVNVLRKAVMNSVPPSGRRLPLPDDGGRTLTVAMPSGRPGSSPDASPFVPTSRRSRALLGVGAMAAVVVIVGAYFALRTTPRREPTDVSSPETAAAAVPAHSALPPATTEPVEPKRPTQESPATTASPAAPQSTAVGARTRRNAQPPPTRTVTTAKEPPPPVAAPPPQTAAPVTSPSKPSTRTLDERDPYAP